MPDLSVEYQFLPGAVGSSTFWQRKDRLPTLSPRYRQDYALTFNHFFSTTDGQFGILMAVRPLIPKVRCCVATPALTLWRRVSNLLEHYT